MSNSAISFPRAVRGRYAAVLAAVANAMVLAPNALADNLSQPAVDLSLGQFAQSASPSPTNLPSFVGPATLLTAAGAAAPNIQYDPLRLHWNVPLPGPEDTVTQGLFGLGRTLNNAGIGYLAYTNSFYSDNILRHGLPLNNTRGNQLYSGQEPTYQTINSFFGILDLNRYGVSDGQIVIGANYTETNWNPLGPRETGISTATYFQTFFNRAVELKVGYVGNSVEFLSTFVGGNIAGGVFGPNASIPVEEGESNAIFPTPGINLIFNISSTVYTKLEFNEQSAQMGLLSKSIRTLPRCASRCRTQVFS